jgi:hypothetical protein
VQFIYKYTLAAADNSNAMLYKYPVGESYSPNNTNAYNTHATMLIKNLTEIIDELRKLFPDCSVQFVKYKDIVSVQDFIVIDWSS